MDYDVAKDVHWIEDATGCRYRVLIDEESSFWYLKAIDGEAGVAYANCQIIDTVMTLHDLRVLDQARPPEKGLVGWLRRMLNWHKKPVNYRKRGLGSALLKFIIATASQRGLLEINGSLSQHDLMQNPNLANWYRRHGFDVSEGGNYGAGRIHLALLLGGHQKA